VRNTFASFHGFITAAWPCGLGRSQMAPKKRSKSTSVFYSCSSSPLSSPPVTPQRNRSPSLIMEAALIADDIEEPVTPPQAPVYGSLVPSFSLAGTPAGKRRRKPSTVPLDGGLAVLPLFPEQHLITHGPLPQDMDVEETEGDPEIPLPLLIEDGTMAQQNSPSSSSQFDPDTAMAQFFLKYRTPPPRTQPSALPFFAPTSDSEDSIVSPSPAPRPTTEATLRHLEWSARNYQPVVKTEEDDELLEDAPNSLRTPRAGRSRSASAPPEMIDLTTPTSPVPPPHPLLLPLQHSFIPNAQIRSL
jgi:hypothetical protein